MFKNFKKGLIFTISIVILLIFFCSGCGRKAPPRPPGKEKLSAANDFKQSLHELIWTYDPLHENQIILDTTDAGYKTIL